MDSVGLESVGFCKGSLLARGPQHWTLAVPGRGSDEVSTSPVLESLEAQFPLHGHTRCQHLVAGMLGQPQAPREL